MVNDLKTKLFSGVIISTKPERVRYELNSKEAFSMGGVVSIVAATAGAIGLLMLVIDRLKLFF
jgi:hypothetical protein